MEIGGFLDIELRKTDSYHPDALALNSCRNALRYLIQCLNIKEIYISYLTCDAVLNSIEAENIKVSFYKLNENLEPINLPLTFAKDTLLLYVNYWGICNKQIDNLIKQYGKSVIVDAAQAFYYKPPKGTYCVNSARKFFGVPDGAYLYLDTYSQPEKQDFSSDRLAHLVKRYEHGAEETYSIYLEAEERIDNLKIARMSNLTKGLLSGVDYIAVSKTRRANFKYLDSVLKKTNLLNISEFYDERSTPMVYPYRTKDTKLRDLLIKNKVFVATYWPNVFNWTKLTDLEFMFAKEIIPLPIDQRYGKNEMNYILNLLR